MSNTNANSGCKNSSAKSCSSVHALQLEQSAQRAGILLSEGIPAASDIVNLRYKSGPQTQYSSGLLNLYALYSPQNNAVEDANSAIDITLPSMRG